MKKNITALSEKNSSPQEIALPHLGRVFFARLFDVFVSSIPSLILVFVFLIQNWLGAFLVVLVSLVSAFIYFIFIPFFTKATTLGKLIFKIRLIRKEKPIKFWAITIREIYYEFIPRLILIISQIVAIIIFVSVSDEHQLENDDFISVLNLVNNLGYLFYVCWYAFICITIYLQKNHQSSIDYKLKIFCIKIIKEKQIKTPKSIKEDDFKPNVKHPGVINVKEIESILEEDNKKEV